MGCFISKNNLKPKIIVTHNNPTISIKISEKEIVCKKETAEMDQVSSLSSDSNTIGHIEDEKDMLPFPEKDYGGDRLALQHHLFKYIWQSNFSAPVDDKLNSGAKVLDFG
ncbi:5395_t:CDS:1, partial [Scutellospora calospora]